MAIEVVFEDGKKGFAYLKSKSLETGAESGDAFSNEFGKSLSRLKGVFAAAIAGLGLAAFTKAAVSAASEQETAINNFNLALARTGQFSDSFSTGFQRLTGEIQNMSKFADEAVLKSAALMQNIGRFSQSELPRATQAAVDLASAYGISLDQAFEAVGKSAIGQVRNLKSLGIIVQEGATQAETYANAMRALGFVQGAAQGELNTFAGAMAKMKNAFGEVLESVGNFITQSPAVVGLLKAMGDIFNDVAKSINQVSFKNFVTQMVNDLLQVSQALNDLLIRPLIRLGEVGVFVFDAIKTGVQTIIVGFADAGVAIGKLLNLVGVISDPALESLRTFADSSRDVLSSFAEETRATFSDIGTSTLADSIDASLLRIQGTIATTTVGMNQFKNSVNLAPVVSELDKQSRAIQNILNSGIKTGIVNSVAAIGTAVAKGQNAFKAFGSQIFSIMGDIAIQLGATFIAIGIGVEAIRNSIIGLTGGPALAVGLALVLLGGFLKGLGGGGSSSGPTTPAAGGGGVSGGDPSVPTSDFGDPQEQERVKPKTEVNINVQGNILDRRESGMAIAEILNEYFDTNDGVLAKT